VIITWNIEETEGETKSCLALLNSLAKVEVEQS